MKMESKQRTGRKTKKRRKTKDQFSKIKQVENTDLSKPVLNKIMATRE